MDTAATIVVYQGMGKLLEGNRLLDPAGMYETTGVLKGDLIELTFEGRDPVVITVAGVLSGQEIVVDGLPQELPEERPVNASFSITRAITEPCPICVTAPSDHKHCWSCQGKLHKDHKKVNCETCLDEVRERLADLKPNVLLKCAPYEETIPVPGTRSSMTVRTKSIEEGDRITEEQEVMLLLNDRPPSPDLLAHDMRMMLMGYAVVEDVNGRKMLESLPPLRDEQGQVLMEQDPVTGEPTGQAKDDTVEHRVRFFAAMRRTRYDAMERVVQHFDMRVSEACAVEIKDDITDEELLIVADHLATQDEPYVGIIKALDGKLPLMFSESTTDDAREVKELLDKWRKAQGRDISEFRYDQMSAVVKLASFFRANPHVDFGNDSALEERLQYILSLPTDLYYHYAAASYVFDERLRRAEGLLKNS